MEKQKTQNSNTTLKEKKKFSRLTLPDLKTYYIATVIERV